MTSPRSVAAVTMSDALLECDVYARPQARVTWLKNGDDVIPSDYFHIVDGRHLKILGLVTSDEGMYQCVASNAAGVIHASAHLTVLPKGCFLSCFGMKLRN